MLLSIAHRIYWKKQTDVWITVCGVAEMCHDQVKLLVGWTGCGMGRTSIACCNCILSMLLLSVSVYLPTQNWNLPRHNWSRCFTGHICFWCPTNGVKALKGSITTTTILRLLYRTTCISWHLQLRSGWFCWSKVLLDGIWIREKTLEFCSMLTNASVCVSGGLVQQRNALIAEIQMLKDDHELAVNALNVTHQLTVQSLTDRLETRFSSQLAAG